MTKRALISVSDKTGIVNFAKELKELNYEIISTGGTYRVLRKNNIKVKKVSTVTKSQEILNGRVKSLHPKIHGGILADRSNESHLTELKEQNIKTIDLVVVNLYPFKNTISKKEVSVKDAIENIDIGGPTLLRAAAKNFRDVTVIVHKEDYNPFLNKVKETGNLDIKMRRELAKKAFQHTADYDTAIANYFSKLTSDDLPDQLNISLPLESELRYGENPHQKAGFYCEKGIFNKLHGKKLSFNNLQDIDAAFRTILEFQEKPTAAILKHCNPCGIGVGENLTAAYRKAFATDTMSPYGGIIIVNKPLDLQMAKAINKIFSEIIIAPEFKEKALTELKKKKNRRLLQYNINDLKQLRENNNYRNCMNGILLQNHDIGWDDERDWEVVTHTVPSDVVMEKLRFAWKVVSLLKSNAIAICDIDRTIGLGMGQPSRIDSTEIALSKAHKFELSTEECVLASDAFFPFRDTIDNIQSKGITGVIQPGGSIRDQEVIDACNEYGIPMIFTGMRHFRH